MASTATLTATVTLSSGDTQDVTSSATWASTDEAVATVSGGTVTAVGVGECTVSATYQGLSADCEVTVADPATALTLSETSLTLDLGEE